ncbi:MAG TPA: hypothetical protein VFS20_27490 [Longimicrobium sp.]|nr:hypothetical protein [Longimicrobium sp.]
MSAPHPHLDDGQVAALADGGPDAPAAAVLAHLAACPACAARVDEARRDWARVTSLLASGDPTPEEWALLPAAPPRAPSIPLRPRRAPWLRWAAAIVGITLLAGMAVPPLRAAVIAWLQRGWSAVAGEDPAPGPVPPPVSPPPAAVEAPQETVVARGPEYQFAPQDGEAVITFRTQPAAGQVLIEKASGSYVVLQSLGTGEGDPVLALPRGLQVQNTASSHDDYRIAVPADLRRLQLRVGRRRVTVELDRVRRGAVTLSLRGNGRTASDSGEIAR